MIQKILRNTKEKLLVEGSAASLQQASRHQIELNIKMEEYFNYYENLCLGVKFKNINSVLRTKCEQFKI